MRPSLPQVCLLIAFIRGRVLTSLLSTQEGYVLRECDAYHRLFLSLNSIFQ
jgi:hypothetical protein